MPRTPHPVPTDPTHAPQGEHLPLPHERDEATGQVAHRGDPVIEQARRDIESGQVDTDMHATPGLDAPRREAIVPTPPTKGAAGPGAAAGAGGSGGAAGAGGAGGAVGPRPQGPAPSDDRRPEPRGR